ncbi:ATP-binding protein [Schinkia azotoformans]|uniref:ATP-binding protein n=1 Tax=Schinkia azotoformans TaxID=1454 RepID=UPI002DB6EF71|nr:ATP-binding protein [Schinkia azotoformans]MEC1773135.1 ATP-binding protein [Schinkia azotoformans]MED4365812.1 ATP-binding protein [Schinkia azotoformans]
MSLLQLMNKTEFKNHEYYIRGEKQRLRQCFLNIIKNCIEAITNPGTVQIHIFHLKNDVVVEITDTGYGMTKEQVQRLGTPYYSTKEPALRSHFL